MADKQIDHFNNDKSINNMNQSSSDCNEIKNQKIQKVIETTSRDQEDMKNLSSNQGGTQLPQQLVLTTKRRNPVVSRAKIAMKSEIEDSALPTAVKSTFSKSHRIVKQYKNDAAEVISEETSEGEDITPQDPREIGGFSLYCKFTQQKINTDRNAELHGNLDSPSIQYNNTSHKNEQI